MTKRFDGVLFDAGGIFVIPDPVATSMAIAPFGWAVAAGTSSGSIGWLVMPNCQR